MSIHSKKPIRTMADMKGVKVASMSRTMSEVVEKLGGTPITMPPADFYASLQRGVVDAAGIGWPGIPPFKLTEVTTYHIQTSLTGEGEHQIMSRDATRSCRKREADDRPARRAALQQMYADAIAAHGQAGHRHDQRRAQPDHRHPGAGGGGALAGPGARRGRRVDQGRPTGSACSPPTAPRSRRSGRGNN